MIVTVAVDGVPIVTPAPVSPTMNDFAPKKDVTVLTPTVIFLEFE